MIGLKYLALLFFALYLASHWIASVLFGGDLVLFGVSIAIIIFIFLVLRKVLKGWWR